MLADGEAVIVPIAHGYWGKMGRGHEHRVLRWIRALPEEHCSRVLVLGCGPTVDTDDLGRRFYHSARRRADGGGYDRTKTVDLVFSDKQDCWTGSLRRLEPRTCDKRGRLYFSLRFQPIDVLQIQLPDASVDLFLAFGLFSPRVDLGGLWQDGLREIARVSTQRGIACVTVPCREGFADLFFEELRAQSMEILEDDTAEDAHPDSRHADAGAERRRLLVFRPRSAAASTPKT